MKINATKMSTPIEERIDDKLKVRIGMVTVSDGKSRPQPVRLHLSMEVLRLQKEEPVPTDQPKKPVTSKERMVQVKRQKVGGLGLSIKGGAEHKLPVLISRIYENQAADATGELFVGDAIIKGTGRCSLIKDTVLYIFALFLVIVTLTVADMERKH